MGLSDGKGKRDWGIHGFARCFEFKYEDKARLIVHVTHPCLTFNDKSKARINPDEELRKAVGLAVAAVLKEHYTLRKKANKHQRRKKGTNGKRRSGQAETNEFKRSCVHSSTRGNRQGI